MSLFFAYAAQSARNAGTAQPENFLMTLLNLAIVFAGLLAVMALVKLIGVVKSGPARRASQSADTPAVPAPGPAVSGRVPAPGSMGEVKLYAVPDRTAALIMAIVADEMHVPLNELRFLSIKEV